MKLNPSSTIRLTLYVVGVFVNAVVGALVASGVEVGVYALAFLAGYNAVLGLMASSNVTPDGE